MKESSAKVQKDKNRCREKKAISCWAKGSGSGSGWVWELVWSTVFSQIARRGGGNPQSQEETLIEGIGSGSWPWLDYFLCEWLWERPRLICLTWVTSIFPAQWRRLCSTVHPLLFALKWCQDFGYYSQRERCPWSMQAADMHWGLPARILPVCLCLSLNGMRLPSHL